MTSPLIIKLGGVLLDSEEALTRLFDALVSYRSTHQRPLLIVHGGGCLVDELMSKLSLPVKKKNGLRVTPAVQIDIITGALAGTANKTLLAWSTKHGIPAVGLCLGDGNSVKVAQFDDELGHVGQASAGSPLLINTLLSLRLPDLVETDQDASTLLRCIFRDTFDDVVATASQRAPLPEAHRSAETSD